MDSQNETHPKDKHPLFSKLLQEEGTQHATLCKHISEFISDHIEKNSNVMSFCGLVYDKDLPLPKAVIQQRQLAC